MSFEVLNDEALGNPEVLLELAKQESLKEGEAFTHISIVARCANGDRKIFSTADMGEIAAARALLDDLFRRAMNEGEDDADPGNDHH